MFLLLFLRVTLNKTLILALEFEKYLSYLATEQKVAASTQNQALSVILFQYYVVVFTLDTPLYK